MITTIEIIVAGTFTVLVSGWCTRWVLKRMDALAARARLRQETTGTPTAQTNPDALTARAQFKQWPPAPDEITPGVGGGTTRGLTRAQVEELGNLWLMVHGGADRMMYADTAADVAVETYFNPVYGWDVMFAKRLDPDQFYVARHVLRTWVETGEEPPRPVPPAQDANALDAEYQRAVALAKRAGLAPPIDAATQEQDSKEQAHAAQQRAQAQVLAKVGADPIPHTVIPVFEKTAVSTTPPGRPAYGFAMDREYRNQTGQEILRRCVHCKSVFDIPPMEILYANCPHCAPAQLNCKP